MMTSSSRTETVEIVWPEAASRTVPHYGNGDLLSAERHHSGCDEERGYRSDSKTGTAYEAHFMVYGCLPNRCGAFFLLRCNHSINDALGGKHRRFIIRFGFLEDSVQRSANAKYAIANLLVGVIPSVH